MGNIEKQTIMADSAMIKRFLCSVGGDQKVEAPSKGTNPRTEFKPSDIGKKSNPSTERKKTQCICYPRGKTLHYSYPQLGVSIAEP